MTDTEKISAIKHLFNNISTHYIDQFKRIGKSTLSNWKEHIDPNDILKEFNNSKSFTTANLSSLLIKIFNTYNFLTISDNAIEFVKIVKSGKYVNNDNFITPEL